MKGSAGGGLLGLRLRNGREWDGRRFMRAAKLLLCGVLWRAASTPTSVGAGNAGWLLTLIGTAGARVAVCAPRVPPGE